MIDLGPYSHFIVSSYAIAGLVLAGLIGWIWLDGRRQRKLLAGLENQGITRRARRSGGPDTGRVSS